MKYLGNKFDIHTGGIDHIPIHHTNEIAQSEAATGKKFVNYWAHGAFLNVNGEKVSKSKGGLYTVSELEEQGFKALGYRYFCLTAHYRTQLEFSLENLKNAQNSYERLKNIVSELADDGKVNEEYLAKFQESIDDDLNMPEALAVLWKLVRDEKAQGKYQTIAKMEKVLGLGLSEKEKIEIPQDIKKIAEERQDARKKKDFKKSDELRDKLNKAGWEIADSVGGYKLKKIGR
jgi:cysteinyl-tRNA synthetase